MKRSRSSLQLSSENKNDLKVKKKPKRYTIFALTNPRSGDGLAANFLNDYPMRNEKEIRLEDRKVTVDMRFYNVREA